MCAGLDMPVGASMVISSDSTGSLSARGGNNDAGIGGGSGSTGGEITIVGGTVTAIGGVSGNSWDAVGAAGIGNAGATVEISGGSVNVVGSLGVRNIVRAARNGDWDALCLVELTDAVVLDGSETVEVEVQVSESVPPYTYRYAGAGHGSAAQADANLYFHLPPGQTYSMVGGPNSYSKTVEYPVVRVDVDAADIGMGSGPGWHYDGTFFSILSNRAYAIRGTSDWVQIAVKSGVMCEIRRHGLQINLANLGEVCVFAIVSNESVAETLEGNNVFPTDPAMQACMCLQVQSCISPRIAQAV
jgi:hypothetical protein